jgi:hypothetical protein
MFNSAMLNKKDCAPIGRINFQQCICKTPCLHLTVWIKKNRMRIISLLALSTLKTSFLYILTVIYAHKWKPNFIDVKGTVSREFRPSVFFHKTIPPRALIHGLKPFWIWLRIRQENLFGNRQNRIPRSQWDRGNRNFLSEFPFNIDFF